MKTFNQFEKYLGFSRISLRRVGQIELMVASLILIGIVLMIIVQVGLNAGLGRPITWEQEGGAYALVWLTFIGGSIALKQLRHVTIVSITSRVSARAGALLRMVVFAVIIWMLCILIFELRRIIPIESRAITVALPIDLPRSWFFSVPLFITSALMLWTSLHYFFEYALVFFSSTDRQVHPLIRFAKSDESTEELAK